MAELEAEPQKTVQTAELEADELQTAVPLTELLTAELEAELHAAVAMAELQATAARGGADGGAAR